MKWSEYWKFWISIQIIGQISFSIFIHPNQTQLKKTCFLSIIVRIENRSFTYLIKHVKHGYEKKVVQSAQRHGISKVWEGFNLSKSFICNIHNPSFIIMCMGVFHNLVLFFLELSSAYYTISKSCFRLETNHQI